MEVKEKYETPMMEMIGFNRVIASYGVRSRRDDSE